MYDSLFWMVSDLARRTRGESLLSKEIRPNTERRPRYPRNSNDSPNSDASIGALALEESTPLLDVPSSLSCQLPLGSAMIIFTVSGSATGVFRSRYWTLKALLHNGHPRR